MRKIFESIEFARVGHYQSILESRGIRTFLNNAASSSLTGEVPFSEVVPELWIVNDAEYDNALRLLREHTTVLPSIGHDWTCPQCGEVVPKGFNQCWNCETKKP